MASSHVRFLNNTRAYEGVPVLCDEKPLAVAGTVAAARWIMAQDAIRIYPATASDSLAVLLPAHMLFDCI